MSNHRINNSKPGLPKETRRDALNPKTETGSSVQKRHAHKGNSANRPGQTEQTYCTKTTQDMINDALD